MAAATIAGALHSKEILQVSIHDAFTHSSNPQQTYIELYEALLQLYLFAGFPAALESLSVLAAVAQERSVHSMTSAEEYDIADFVQRGEDVCQRIYTTTYQKMRQNLERVSPDLDAWVVVEGYGKTLSREGLNLQHRELLIVAALAALGWTRQLYSHLRGAMNVGASQDECRAVLDILRDLSSHNVFQHGMYRLPLYARYKAALEVFDSLTQKSALAL
jgi:4-carboxymuconolactone decarboxylase